MILVTGGTGFVGRALVRNLVESGYPVRTLVRPSAQTPRLPRGVPVEVAVSSLTDERGLRGAMVGVDVLYHLAGVERGSPYASLSDVDIDGTRAVVDAAADAGIERIFFVSHLGADRASAYPVIKAKGIAEDFIRRSGIDFTILRSAITFGPEDGFTTGLAALLHALPYIFLVPGDGKTLLQPIWVEDLAVCLTWALDDQTTRNETYEVGGPEYFSFNPVPRLDFSRTAQLCLLAGLSGDQPHLCAGYRAAGIQPDAGTFIAEPGLSGGRELARYLATEPVPPSFKMKRISW
jgi:uncharacterized protein YbjT (DUF2867 family)